MTVNNTKSDEPNRSDYGTISVDEVGDNVDNSYCTEYTLPDYPTISDYLTYPYRAAEYFIQGICHHFGWEFAIMTISTYIGIKGLLLSILGQVRLSFCKKTLGIDGTACQTLGAIAGTPWAVKGAIGVISDMYPLFGWHKASYINVVGVLGALAFLFLAAVPITTAHAAGFLLLLGNLQIATTDLLMEGQYAGKMAAKPQTGSMMVSFVWGCFQIGSLLAACFVGPLVDAFNPKIVFWVCVPLSALIIVPNSLGYMGDTRVPEDRRGVDWELLRTNKLLIVFCLVVAGCAVVNAVIDLVFFDAHLAQMIYALACTVWLSVLSFAWLPPQLAKCTFYMFLSCVLYVNIGSAQDYWFTADKECVPDGPGFDYTYYNTYTSIVGAFTGWVGIVLFQATMSGWSFRKLFWITTLLQVVASAFDMLIIARWNISVGISDKVFYMFGDAVIGPAVGMFAYMPMLVLTSKLVPPGLEATTYALLAGFQNFGGTVSSQVGIYLTQLAGIESTGRCNFDNLGPLVGVCHCLLPLLAIPLTFLLIPDKLMTDRILDSDDSDAPAPDAGPGPAKPAEPVV